MSLLSKSGTLLSECDGRAQPFARLLGSDPVDTQYNFELASPDPRAGKPPKTCSTLVMRGSCSTADGIHALHLSKQSSTPAARNSSARTATARSTWPGSHRSSMSSTSEGTLICIPSPSKRPAARREVLLKPLLKLGDDDVSPCAARSAMQSSLHIPGDSSSHALLGACHAAARKRACAGQNSAVPRSISN